VFKTPSNACGLGYVGYYKVVLDFQLSKDQQHLTTIPPFSHAIIVVDALFFFIGSIACTTFTSLLHAK
jgi:hypothetical protein